MQTSLHDKHTRYSRNCNSLSCHKCVAACLLSKKIWKSTLFIVQIQINSTIYTWLYYSLPWQRVVLQISFWKRIFLWLSSTVTTLVPWLTNPVKTLVLWLPAPWQLYSHDCHDNTDLMTSLWQLKYQRALQLRKNPSSDSPAPWQP